jgi:3-isopropylmalate/(R)-2-methylmalate dehydratase small subunit
MTTIDLSQPVTGRIWKYGDSVNTDVIFPGKYTYTKQEPEEIAPHALEDLDPAFAGAVQAGDIVVGGINWGCGSSREQAAGCLRACGVSAVIAKSFSRIFYRNAINSGLLVIAHEEAAEALAAGDEAIIDFQSGTITSGSNVWQIPEMSESLRQILLSGGLIPYAKAQLEAAR